MKTIRFFLTAIIAMMACSCSVYRHSVDVSDFSTNAYSDDIYADLSINTSNKIHGKSRAVFLFNFIQIGGGRDYADIHQVSTDGNPITALANVFGNRGDKFRSLALGAAVKDSDYDVILNPRYKSFTRGFLGIITVYEVEVTGYGAKISELSTQPHKFLPNKTISIINE